MKKILIASDCFLPRWDGIARFISEIIPVLKDRYRITVIAPDFPGSKKTFKGVRVIRIKTYSFQVGDYSPPRIRVKLIGEELAKHDIIFTHTIGPIGAVAAIHGHRLGKPVVSYIHSLEWELFAKSISENKHVRKSVHHITQSFVRRIYSENTRLLLPSRKVGTLLKGIGIPVPGSVVKLGINTKNFSPGDKKAAKKRLKLPKGFIIGYAGRIGIPPEITVITLRKPTS
jgi:glycosyltransferase involved in cell wall biosynthesis